MTKVKICGITNLEDALLAAEYGADMLGFNFYAKSPRYISPENALEIIEKLPKGIGKVGVFVNETQKRLLDIAKLTGIDTFQLHGDETPEFVSELRPQTGLPIIKAMRVAENFATEHAMRYSVDAILLDTYSQNAFGGTGEAFEWQKAIALARNVERLFLAGGLHPDNVADAIRKVGPYAVDVASGVESAKGKKDAAKLKEFIENAKRA